MSGKNPQDLGEIIREHCPKLTESRQAKVDKYYDELEKVSPAQPNQLGAANTARLMTYVYGLLLNGYSSIVVAENASSLFCINLSEEDILFIEKCIEFEAELASRTLLP